MAALVCLLWGAIAPLAFAQEGPAENATIELRVDQTFRDSGARPGDILPIRVLVRDLGLQARDVVIRVVGDDPDGDVPLYERVVSTNVAGSVSGLKPVWVYVPLPRDFSLGSPPLVITAHPAGEDGTASADTQLGRLEYRPSQVVSQFDGLMMVVGNRDLGLSDYQTPGLPGVAFPSRAHELTRVITGVTPAEMPDRWHGWLGVETLVWGGTGSEFGPGSLLQVQAEAIEHWVRRGGHLVVVLGTDTQVWTSRSSNRLREILPVMASAPVEHEGVDLSGWRALLTTRPEVPLPERATVRELMPDASAGPGMSTPILESPEGWCIALRREVGAGAVTLIGVDLADARFRRAGSLQAHSFWHRVLGRRGGVLTEAELVSNNMLNRLEERAASGVLLDDGVGAFIAKSGRSLQGLFFAIIIFAVYWVMAGPGGFALLAKWKRKQHAWVGFVAVIAVCTGVAWTTALGLRPKRVEATQLTVIEMVHGQETARAKTWASVLVPRYGRASIGVGTSGEGAERVGELVGPDVVRVWRPRTGLGNAQSFPDNAAYSVSSASPESIRVVTRATVKQVTADWAGVVPTSVGIRPYATPGDPQVLRAVRETGTSRWSVSGTLVHGFGGPLEDVQVIAVLGQDRLNLRGVRATDGLVSGLRLRARSLVGDWAPGVPLPLEQMFATEGSTSVLNEGEAALKRLVPRSGGVQGLATRGVDALEGLRGALLYPALPPWDPQDNALSKLVRRTEMHGFDVGRWFTQPCVIVVGVLRHDGETDGLVPVTVDGREAESEGATLVVWVYPLEASPPGWPTLDDATGSGSDE